MPRMAGKIALMESLRAEGVRYIFGNPGTSEAPIMSALEAYPDLDYVLAVQEGVAMGMADGYARRTGKPSFVNLHIHSGLANGISLLSDSYSAGIPIVLTAGNSDARKLAEGRHDLTRLVEPFVKWSAEITHPGQIASVIRRAFTEAKTPPTGPVFVSLAANALDDEADNDIYPSGNPYVATAPAEDGIAAAVEVLADAERPVMVVGDRVSQRGATLDAVRVAERIGARVYSAGYTQVVFPTSHPQYLGMLSLRSPAIRQDLRRADAVLAVGARVFAEFFYNPDPVLGPGAKLIHIDSNAVELGRSEKTGVAILADPRAALESLADALDDSMSGSSMEAAKSRASSLGALTRAAQDSFNEEMRRADDTRPMSAARLMTELASAWPGDAVMVDDAISSRGALYSAIKFDQPGSLEGEVGQAIGWGMGAALGVKLGSPNRPVISVLGDGSAMMSVQALWTAASRRIPVVYVVCNNASYRILRLNMNVYLDQVLRDPSHARAYKGTEFSPAFDFAAISRAFGVNAARIEDPAEIAPTLTAALEANEPYLMDVVIDGSL